MPSHDHERYPPDLPGDPPFRRGSWVRPVSCGLIIACGVLAGGVFLAALFADVEHAHVPVFEGAEPRPGERAPEAFYTPTLGNEVFLTDVLGVADGPAGVAELFRALAALAGEGTTNLRVRLSGRFGAGGRTWERGGLIDTGLDVPEGALAPLGVSFHYSREHFRVGVTCALCHASVDERTGRVIEGRPNRDLNIGLLLAMAPNTAALFTLADTPPIGAYVEDLERDVVTAAGVRVALPEPDAFERAVDAALVDKRLATSCPPHPSRRPTPRMAVCARGVPSASPPASMMERSSRPRTSTHGSTSA